MFTAHHIVILTVMFSLASLNCNGLRNHIKRKELFTYFEENKLDILLLQETFWDTTIHDRACREWNGTIVSSFYSTLKRRGVSCLINQNSGITITFQKSYNCGRLLHLDLRVDERDFSIINIYAPNDPAERKHFFADLSDIIARIQHPLVIAGDFNAVLNTDLDKYPPRPTRDVSRKALNDVMVENNLTDIWRDRNQYLVAFTRSRYAGNTMSASRIDRFIISRTLSPNVKNCDIRIYPHSDHDIIYLELDLSLIPRGEGVWVFNNNLLGDEIFLNDMKHLLISAKNDSMFESNFLIWYDNLKNRIKEKSIRYSKHKHRAANRQKKLLEKQITYEKVKMHKCSDYDITRLRNLENQLNSMITEEIKGAALRSKVQWLEEGEKSSKFFLNLEKSRQEKKVMKSLFREDGALMHDQKDISEEQIRFYGHLYKAGNPDNSAQSMLIGNITRGLSDFHRQACDADITLQELQAALFAMGSHKSPGLDGLTPEFYKAFWAELGDIIVMLAQNSIDNDKLPQSMRTGLITLIPKKGDLRHLTNWRPISLLNIDYKIITKTLANRVSRVIHTLISEDQSCCVPGRNIADNVILIDNIMQYLQNNNMKGYILKIDQYKAFDRVEHSYLLKVLDQMGFGDYFLRWVKILYTDIVGCIKHNGNVSATFPIERGVRQGCPLSAILYVLCAEPLHEIISNSDQVSGIELLGNQVKVFQHADDTTFLLSDASSVDRIFDLLAVYELASGSKCNRKKTELFVIGDQRGSNLNFDFPVRHDHIDILGVSLGKDRSVVEKRNWGDRTAHCITILKRWKKRNLSFKGKAIVINSLIISRLVYHASILPVPKWVIDDIHEGITTFLWDNKTPLIAFDVLALPKEKGGLNICSMGCKRDSLRIRLVSRLLSKDVSNKLRDVMLYNLNHYGDMKLGIDVFRILPQFGTIRNLPIYYQELFLAWRKISNGVLLPPIERDDILRQPLFHNPFITDRNGKVFYNSDFVQGEVVFCSDVMYEMIPQRLPAEAIHESIVMVYPECRSEVGDIGTYLETIIQAMPSNWLDKIFSGDSIVSTSDNNTILLKLEHGDTWIDASNVTSKVASLLLRSKTDFYPKGEAYWKSHYDNIHFDKLWDSVYGGIKDNHDADLDFKIMHNILFTNQKLYKCKLISSPLCTFCHKEVETIEHLFINCSQVKYLWGDLTQKLENIHQVDSWSRCTLFGLPLHKKEKVKILFDFLLNIYKKVIWSCRLYMIREDAHSHNISIDKIYHNTLRKKIRILYHYFSNKKDSATFWQIFDEADSGVIIERKFDDLCIYNYIFDTK